MQQLNNRQVLLDILMLKNYKFNFVFEHWKMIKKLKSSEKIRKYYEKTISSEQHLLWFFTKRRLILQITKIFLKIVYFWIHQLTPINALAIAILCLCPPDNAIPLSPTIVSCPSGRDFTKSNTFASFITVFNFSLSISSFSLAPYRIFSFILPLNKTGS